MKNRLFLIVILVMSLVLVTGCNLNKNDSKDILEKMDEVLKQFDDVGKDELTGDTSGLDPITIYIYTEEAYNIVRTISEKLLDSKESDTDTLYDEYILNIYIGNFLIEYQGNSSIYEVGENGKKTLIKTAYNAGKIISDDIQKLLTLVKSQNH